MTDHHHGSTHRLDWADPTLREWDAAVVFSDPELGIVLDRSAFYPGGGGQPPDYGVLLWQGVQTRVVGTRIGDELYLLAGEGDPVPPTGVRVRGAIEDERRTSLMRTHSGLHVVCGVIFRDFQALATGSNMEPLVGRIDFNLPEVPAGFKTDVEAAINAEIVADRAIVARVLPRAEALAIPNVVKTEAGLVPADSAQLRIIDVVGLDIQTDGGTHVASTRQIGTVEVVKVESKGRSNRRLRLRVHD